MNELITGDDWMLKVDGKRNGLELWKGLFLVLFCGVLFVLNALPAEATTVASGTCGENLTWTLDDEGTMTISGTGEMTDFLSFAPWNSSHSSIKSLVIENSVTSIGNHAFSGCYNLTSVTIPNSVTSIGDSAFYRCSNLPGVTIPNSVTSIGDSAFSGCYNLTSVTIPNSVTSIGNSAFFDCSNLTSIIIPNSVTSIGDGFFYNCSNLTSITIPNSVTSIGSDAFYRCHNLTSITIPNSVTSIGSRAFYRCYRLTSITIPNSVTSIGNSAFSGCYRLTSITVPNSVTSIGNSAFFDCYNLTSIIIPDSVTSIGDGFFFNCSNLTSIIIPDSVTSVGSDAFYGCTSLTSITIPDSVTSIGSDAFYGCTSLTSVAIPNGVTSIGNFAFYSCTSLTSITIPNSVTSIGDSVFSYCSSLGNIKLLSGNFSYCVINGILYDYNRTELIRSETGVSSCDIPSTVTKIRNGAFSGCKGLISLNIPVSVSEIEGDNFCNCDGLNIVYYSGTSAQAENMIIVGKNGMLLTAEWICSDKHLIRTLGGTTEDGIDWQLTTDGHLTISGTGDIYEWSDYPWDQLSNVIKVIDISEGITYIGDDYQFEAYDNLISVTIPSSITYIGLNFTACKNLLCITVDPQNTEYMSVDGVLFEKSYAMLICYPAQKTAAFYTIPEGTERIGMDAFSNSSSIESIILPNSVTYIDIGAFGSCVHLSNVFYTGTEEQWKNIEIEQDNEYLLSASITYGLTLIDKGDFDNGFSWTLNADYQLTIDGTGAMPEYGKAPWELYKSEIRSLVIQNGITSISNSAFHDCNGLMSINIPASLTSIGDSAFGNCNSLTGILIPEGVNDIGEYPFPNNVSIYCYEYTYAQFWADDHGYTFVLLDNGELSDDMVVTLPTTRTVMAGTVSKMGENIFPITEELTIVWSSSNTNVADISENGLLTAYKAGTTTVTLSAGGKTAQCTVTVVQGAESFEITEDIYVETTKTIQVTPFNIIPADATLELNWAVGNTLNATVSSTGLITGKAVGETTLTVTDAISGLTRTATIHICYPVQTVMLTIDETSIYAGLSTRATALVTTTKGQSYENKLVTFSSSDPSVATVDQQGNIQTIKAGTVTITATAANGVTASKTLTVEAFQHILSLPVRLGEIESEAFSALTAVEAVRIPEEVYYIADDAFAGSDIIILTPENSYAAQWAKDHGMTVIEESSR